MLTMNKLQKIILAVYSLLVFAMVIFPPYVVIYNNIRFESNYSFIWKPLEYDNRIPGEIDISKFMIQLLGLTLVTIALLLILKDNKGHGKS